MKQLLFILSVISFTSFGQQNSKEKRMILFVCEHGGARSLIASMYFNKIAAEKGLNYTSVFRGTNPDPDLNEATVTGLKKDGFAVPDQKPISVSAADEKGASLIVTFDCQLPAESTIPKENWGNISSINQNYAKARDEIVKHVHDLIAALKE